MREKQDHILPVGGKATLPEEECTTRHTDKNRIPHNEGKKSRGGLLEETPKDTHQP